jgi:DNA repair exonuclease SbcCD nuclease subunit
VKFLHTADWQIGMKAAHVGSRSTDVRRARFESAERVIRIAQQRGADAILVTGDTFEDNAVSTVDVQRVSDILAAFGGPVYIISGNHDPSVAASLWQHAGWRRPNLHLLLDETPFEAAPGVTLYPCPLTTKTSSLDPTAWIAGAGGDGVRIGLAHGSVPGANVAENCFPIPRDAPRRCGLDYLALGHWHSTASFDEPLESARMAYAGTHEQTKFGERDSGNALLVEVRERGALPIIEQIATGSLTWLELKRSVEVAPDIERLRQHIEALPNAATTLLKVSLEGVLHPDALEELERLRDVIEARFSLFHKLDDSSLLPAPSDASWVERLPLGLVRGVAERLLSGTAFTNDPEAARNALMRLYRLAHNAEVAR